LIIRIGGIREGRNRAHREDEQGLVQPIERATGDIAGVVHKAVCFLYVQFTRFMPFSQHRSYSGLLHL
jgi:hypothetical protein